MAVARRTVDGDPIVHQALAGFVDILHPIGEMAEIAATAIAPFVPIVGELHLGILVAGHCEEYQGEAALVIVHPAHFLQTQQVEEADRSRNLLIAAAILALGVVLGGYLLGDGLRRARMADRSVTVHGLAERDVNADLATWTIAYTEQGTELAAVQSAIDQDTRAIAGFFRSAGFRDRDIGSAGVSVNQYYDSNRGQNNVTVRRRLQLRTTDVTKARTAYARQFDLIRGGVAVEEGSGMVYSFTKLNDIKPAMIAEATRDARRGAEQFAEDSGTKVGGIKQATQGYFSIGARDGDEGASGNDSPFQKVRVVTTIDFYLD